MALDTFHTWLPPACSRIFRTFHALPFAGVVPPHSRSSKHPLPAPASPEEEETQRRLQLSELGFFSKWDRCSPVKAAAMFPCWKGLFMRETKQMNVVLERWTFVAGMKSVRCLLLVSLGGNVVPFHLRLLLGLFQHPKTQRAETWNFSKNQRLLETWRWSPDDVTGQWG